MLCPIGLIMKYPNNRRLGRSLVVTEGRRDQGSRVVCGQPAPWRLFQFNMKKERNMLDWVMIVIATISLGIVIFSIWSMMRA